MQGVHGSREVRRKEVSAAVATGTGSAELKRASTPDGLVAIYAIKRSVSQLVP